METIYLNDLAIKPEQMNDISNKVAAIGFFDGIHLGHQAVIKKAVQYAKVHQLKSAVITFFPHPSVVLNKDKSDVQYITPSVEKEKVLEDLNVDFLYIIKFNKDLASMSPEKFLSEFIISLNVKHLIAGFDFTFGFKGAANMENIESFSKSAFTAEVVPKVQLNDEKISSTKVRSLLKEGKVDHAHTLLGRPLRTRGKVVHGFKRGRDIGYPTANLEISPQALLPRTGVYATKVHYNSETFYAMTSLGFNPTFKENPNDLKLEINIFNFQGDLYGKELIIDWYKFIRDEQKYNGMEELVTQIKKDEVEIKQYFNII